MAKKFNNMSRSEQRKYNAKTLEEAEDKGIQLNPKIDWLDKHPLYVLGAVGRVKKLWNAEQLTELAWKTGGNITEMARFCRVTRVTMKKWVDQDKLHDTLASIGEAWLDSAEDVLKEHVVSGKSLDATKFLLKTKGKDRGYYEKQESTVSHNIKVTLESSEPPPALESKDHTYLTDAEYEADKKES